MIPYVEFLGFFVVMEYPLFLIVAVVYPGLFSFDCCVFDVSSSWLILLLVKITPCFILKSQLNVVNILPHCCKLIQAMTQIFHFKLI